MQLGDANIFHEAFSNLEGAKLATSLSKETRWDMISKGYNPMVEEDIKAYKQGMKPVYGNAELASRMGNNLGMSRSRETENRAIEEQIQTGSFNDTPVAPNTKEEFLSSVNTKSSYSSGSNLTESLNQRLLSKLNTDPTPTNNELITDKDKIKKLGYGLGKRYIQAFKEYHTNKNEVSKAKLLKEQRFLTEAEKKIHPSLVDIYKQGVNQAEQEG